ncbi:hypothetical protein EVAR_11687_1 [Eumeta japonica]|uniref:Uncharacterized protein n=1 Tax=Eumeta variegata TaxID=151549 RepID=A0A4C1U4M6_EUMVA|nr:hypothetical protein EVAR_11687_1 [Eumeta japonica]
MIRIQSETETEIENGTRVENECEIKTVIESKRKRKLRSCWCSCAHYSVLWIEIRSGGADSRVSVHDLGLSSNPSVLAAVAAFPGIAAVKALCKTRRRAGTTARWRAARGPGARPSRHETTIMFLPP